MDKLVRTVLGDVASSELGVILPHEHIMVDFNKGFLSHPLLPDGRNLADLQLTLENMGLIRRYPYGVRKNLLMDDVNRARRELELYKLVGGGTICELSVVGIRRSNHSPADLVNLSKATGVHIVSATGFYCDKFLPDWVKDLTVRDMTDYMMEEIVNGVGGSGVKCGVMYVGCSDPTTEVEKRVLEAAAVIHKETGTAIAIHPGRGKRSPFEILDFLALNKVPELAVSVSHVDRTFTDSTADVKKMCELCQRGCYVNHSLFGKECSHYEYDLNFDMPNDAQRIQRVKALISGGCAGQVLVSHDVVCQHELTCYGGYGYSHILENIAPKFIERGVKPIILQKILNDNPRHWLTAS